jgi:hypothetical protein
MLSHRKPADNSAGQPCRDEEAFNSHGVTNLPKVRSPIEVD